jgi:hypothetical protein
MPKTLDSERLIRFSHCDPAGIVPVEQGGGAPL